MLANVSYEVEVKDIWICLLETPRAPAGSFVFYGKLRGDYDKAGPYAFQTTQRCTRPDPIVYPRESGAEQLIDHDGRAKFGLYLRDCELRIQGNLRQVPCELRHGKVEIFQKE
jgi:hypothetical protein